MIDPKQPTTTQEKPKEEVTQEAWLLEELQELLNDKEEYHWG